MLQIHHLTAGYAGKPVFETLSVDFSPGAITGIIGPNGAGKSTLIKAVLGLIPRQAGTVTFAGQPIKKLRRQIAYVEQRADLDLSFPINVEELVLTGTYSKLGLFKTPGKAERQAAQAALAQVKLLDFRKRQIGELSGGTITAGVCCPGYCSRGTGCDFR